MSIEAMKQALEALEQHGMPLLNHEDAYAKSLNALRQAIANAEKQEPVIDKSAAKRIAMQLGWEPKREWVGLTDEEIMEMLDYGQYGRVPQYARNFVDVIEAKLRESNEAKAWFTVDEFNEWVEKLIEKEKDKWLNLMSGQKNS